MIRPIVLLSVVLVPPLLSLAPAAPGPDGEGGAAPLTIAQQSRGLAECEREVTRLRELLARERDERRSLEVQLRAEYESEIAQLQNDLRVERERHFAREREWLEVSKALAVLDLDPEAPTVVAPAEASTEAEACPSPAELRTAQRDREVFVALNSLLRVEEVRGLDLLEAGRVEGGATGPVVLRLIDDRGRPYGTLVAERLRLEGSDSGRTLTLVFEAGYERKSGRIAPFEGESRAEVFGPTVDTELRRGVRRITLPHTDPQPWREALPELFDPVEQADVARGPVDDGLHDRNHVRTVLNRFLREDGGTGHWRLEAVAGIRGGVLFDVQLADVDRQGGLRRRLFADRMHVLPLDRGVLLLLESGVQMRHGRKAPFLDGRYRIFLPRADCEAWRRAGLPVQEAAARSEGAGETPAPEPEPAVEAGSRPPR